jgi:Xaa-Pro aminopeptidase
MQDQFRIRRDKVCRSTYKSGADGLLVTDFTNVTYLTGFTGDDSFLLLWKGGAILLSDGRYLIQLQEECPDLDLHIRKPGVPMVQAIKRAIRSSGIRRLALEGESMTCALRDQLADDLPNLDFVNTSGMVERFRALKDRWEIEQLRQAVWYAERGVGVLRATLRPEKTEKQVADELETQLRLFGAKGCSFPTIVAAGPRAALAHARATQQEIGTSDFVLVDWGADGGLYKSDLTRVLVTGRISPKLERVYRVVLRAQLKAIAAVRPGIVASDVDRAAREVIHESGFGRHFNHGVGHGLGLQVHEFPRMSPSSRVVLKPGMVVTVEPGIYLPGWGGVRIEDDLLVTRTGHEVLTHVPKQLEEVVVGE